MNYTLIVNMTTDEFSRACGLFSPTLVIPFRVDVLLACEMNDSMKVFDFRII